MTCKEALRLVELFREGDRSLTEETRLARHLFRCASCRAAMEEAKGFGEILTTLRTQQPALNDPVGLTNDIMRSLPQDRRGWWEGIPLRLAPRELKASRAIALATLAVLLLTLAGQSTIDAWEISRLEQRIGSQTQRVSSALMFTPIEMFAMLSKEQREELTQWYTAAFQTSDAQRVWLERGVWTADFSVLKALRRSGVDLQDVARIRKGTMPHVEKEGQNHAQ